MTDISTGSLIISRTRVDPLIDEEEADAVRSPDEVTCDISTVAFSNLTLQSTEEIANAVTQQR